MKRIVTLVIILTCTWLIVNNPYTRHYITTLKMESVPVSGKEENTLYHEIESKAANYEVEPIDAKIDPVWKAIPGYNGLKVNVEESYKKMKDRNRFSEELLVYDEVKPKVHLRDLPPAAIYKGNPEKPMVSFIINVAWGNEYLSDMLATLKKHHITATFFLEGRWVKNHPELAKMIVEAGHEVGNHSFSHPDMKSLSSGRIHEEIKRTNEVIEATTGKRPHWFAPPSGSYKEEVAKVAAVHRLGTVMWSVDTIDWQKPSPEVLTQRVTSKLHNGAMILMHPTDSTTKALNGLITEIKARDLQIGPVSELLSEERIMNRDMKQNVE
ncbi:polysaccharide deacetylase family protein [Bacillus sp. B15-48]|uniref:polysaccharide deacetylase family protein n=1 Tax=Bacillus sp. B15-48 TaxID=1548601 RepID=UPI0019401DE8|nr:polysaccharide deacetylase family protein [Bacillus sp. B15-48]